MPIVVYIVIALVATVPTSVLAMRYRRARHEAYAPMVRAFRRREFRTFDAHLEAVAREELHRLEHELARYLAGRAGHVVVVSKEPSGIALELSDGRRIALRGISSRTVELLERLALVDTLHPESLDRVAVSYRLVLRGPAGAAINIYARNVALAS